MRRFKRALLILLASMQVFGAACRKKERLVIAVVPKAQAHIFWQTVHAGAVAAGEELGVEVRWNGPASEIDFSRQINVVDDFINQRVDGIALAPSHGESLVPIVERRMGEILPDGGKIAMIGTIPGSVSTTERENGFRETIQRDFPKLKIGPFQYGMSDRAKGLAVAEDILTAHPDLIAIFCSNESGTIGAVQAAKSKGVAGKLKIVGFDTSPTLIEDLESGNIDSLVVQNPFRMGYLAVKTLVEHLRGHSPEKRIDTGATVVTAANLREPSIQYLVNPPIQKYLK